MAAPTEPIKIIATDALGGDGFTNKEEPDGLINTEGYGKQSLPYQQLNYLMNNFGEWLTYINEEQIPDLDDDLQDQIDTINNTTIQAAIDASLLARDNARYPIGHTLLTMTSTNPSAGGYPGTWTLLYTADADIKLGDGSNQSGTATGDNTPNVPLKDHTHTYSGTTSTDGSHTHSGNLGENRDTATPFAVPSQSSNADDGLDYTTNSNGSHNHTYSGTTANAGDGAAPTLDVSGKGVAINVWERTA